MKGEKLTIEGELQQKSKLEERKVTLTADNANFERDIEEARSQLKPIENNIRKVNFHLLGFHYFLTDFFTIQYIFDPL